MNKQFLRDRIKDTLWIVAFMGLVAGVGRFVVGLGAAGLMSDALPWGMWKILNMVAGAAIATGGFVTAAIIYVFQMEKYRPMARVSILVAFLGYGASLTALLFDIGLPHRFWHPFIMWNPHSFLFEVFWCVSFYWAVTAFEMLPIIFERFPWPKLVHFLHEIALPIIVVGITLSTMHHSSLGSLFMTSPTRLHPLWFSTWIPIEFFSSAMGAGLGLLVGIVLMYSYLYDKPANFGVLKGLARGSAGLLLVYLAIKVTDFTVHDKWKFVFGPDLTWESKVFWVEIILQVFIPVFIFLNPLTVRSRSVLFAGSMSAAIGCVMHRVDTGIVGYFRSAGRTYFPNLSEIALSLGVVAAAGIAFFFIVEHFYVFEAPEDQDVKGHGAHPDSVKVWTFDEVRGLIFSATSARVAVIFVIVMPLSFFVLRGGAVTPFKPDYQPVRAAVKVDDNKKTINGNGDEEAVRFNHKLHHEKLGGDNACVKCHHLGVPGNDTPPCSSCHRDMQLPTNTFDRDKHEKAFAEAKLKGELKLPPKIEDAAGCFFCHAKDMKGLTNYTEKNFSFMAVGYQQAMHGQCLTCHRKLGAENRCMTEAECTGNCQFCHPLKPDGKSIYGR